MKLKGWALVREEEDYGFGLRLGLHKGRKRRKERKRNRWTGGGVMQNANSAAECEKVWSDMYHGPFSTKSLAELLT